MKMFKSIAVAALFAVSTVRAATKAYDWAYLANGADWPLLRAEGTQCHLPNQSPIDLRRADHPNAFQIGNGKEFKWQYRNFKGASVTNLGKTIQVNFPEDAGKENWFKSGYAKNVLGANEQFNSAQFHFHAKSEHTINGKRYDFEMHTVHLPESATGGGGLDGSVPIIASAVGLMFDVDDYDPTISAEDRKIIDKFFDSMDFDNVPSGVAKGHVLKENATIPFGDLMKIVNFASRWVYTGSLTTPPCSVGVYFQVVDRVLPISQRHFDAYLKQQRQQLQFAWAESDGADKHKISNYTTGRRLDITGNWRVTNAIDNHNVTYMQGGMVDSNQAERHRMVTIVVAILFAVALLISAILGYVAFKFNKKIKEMKGGDGAESARVELKQMN